MTSAAIEAAARAMCDRVNGIGDYDEHIDQRRAGWLAQAKVGVDAYLATTTTVLPDAAGQYEARFVAGGAPTDCVDYAVVSLAKGVEVCRVWQADDARLIADLLNATPPASDAAVPAGEVERLRADLRNVQRNTAIYRQEAKDRADAAERRAAAESARADAAVEANRRLVAMMEAPKVASEAGAGFVPNEREKAVIDELCAKQDLSPQALIRQALRLYQIDYARRAAGETVSWSGDYQRLLDFAGLLVSPEHPLMLRAYEVVHHDEGCPSIGGNGDKDCKCDAVPFLNDLRKALSTDATDGATVASEAAGLREAATGVLARWDGASSQTMVELMDALRKALTHPAPSGALGEGKPFAYFIHNEGWDMWEQVADEYAQADPDIVAAYSHPPATTPGGGLLEQAVERVLAWAGPIAGDNTDEDAATEEEASVLALREAIRALSPARDGAGS